jgi:meso-butanediol dehydrogenase/(S,S)-butanediol dehydrogenase/diacetyl reductase
MTRELEGKSIVVTGAGRGIGEAIARGLAAAGARVTIGDIDAATATAAAKRISDEGGQAIGVAANVVERKQVAALLDAAQAAFGPLYGIVNNAGIAQILPFLLITEDDWRRTMEVNSLGVMICMQEAAKRLVAQGKGGRIVNIASIAGKQGYEPLAHYCASKFSVIGFTQAGAKAFGRHQITVNAICPGVVGTEMWRTIAQQFYDQGLAETPTSAFDAFAAGAVLGRSSVPEDLTGVCRYFMSEAGGFTTGQSVNVDGGMVYD